MVEQQVREGRSLAETPTWAVATVVTFMVTLGFFFQTILKQFGKWLDKTKRKSLLAALAKIKDALSSKFYPCELKGYSRSVQRISVSSSDYLNKTLVGEQLNTRQHQYCPEGRESFASYESLEQLHRFIFVLGVTHVSYSFVSIALGMIKIYSWRIWENQAKTMAIQSIQGSSEDASSSRKLMRLSTFVFHHTSHPWSQHGILVWLVI
ncbi:hypothetical protein Pint_28463 [Pistacia integerrima]|uniref:Uncharacterized protein n=1 Tax=Pistacia integerrima TaxID=434235 RepID=A0ACC0YQA7_9ROSI|nr:hypothetical protein Pint_28463 [Pistacia integerrima]